MIACCTCGTWVEDDEASYPNGYPVCDKCASTIYEWEILNGRMKRFIKCNEERHFENINGLSHSPMEEREGAKSDPPFSEASQKSEGDENER